MGTCLLSTAERLSAFGEGFVNFFTSFKVMYAVEILFFYLVIYFVSKILRENEASKMMFGYWLILLVGGAITLFADNVSGVPLVSGTFYLAFVILISAFMLILFNMEVKKKVWDMNSKKVIHTEKSSGNNAEIRSHADTERCITNVIKALQNMSKNNVGALVVLSKGSLPRQVLHSGVEIQAEISTQLIEGIFFPKAPLHDGAMIIQGHKIQAAGCFLPLTQKTSYPKEYGTRHRAAIGITEVANVISLVVSEETGIISIVKQGNVTRYADYDMLLDALKDYYWQEMPLTDKKQRGGNR